MSITFRPRAAGAIESEKRFNHKEHDLCLVQVVQAVQIVQAVQAEMGSLNNLNVLNILNARLRHQL
jgi:hypothetical protein